MLVSDARGVVGNENLQHNTLVRPSPCRFSTSTYWLTHLFRKNSSTGCLTFTNDWQKYLAPHSPSRLCKTIGSRQLISLSRGLAGLVLLSLHIYAV